jgi:hypothetical protein
MWQAAVSGYTPVLIRMSNSQSEPHGWSWRSRAYSPSGLPCIRFGKVRKLKSPQVQPLTPVFAIGFGGAGGHLKLNVYKPLMINGIMQSITLLADGCDSRLHRHSLREGK